MQDIYSQLSREAVSPKFANLRKACKEATDMLEDRSFCAVTETAKLREKCLQPLKLALETKNIRLCALALNGIQCLMDDEQYQSSMESEEEDSWVAMQVIQTVWSTPSLPDDTQVETMKLLLKLAVSSALWMNAKVIIKITEVSMATYGASNQTGVRTAVKATLTQLLSALVEKLREKEALRDEEDTDSAIAEFSSKCEAVGSSESLLHDVVQILQYLCDKLANVNSSIHIQKTVPLVLEAIYTILVNLPVSIRFNQKFVNIVWQDLCPHMLLLLGNPLTDKNISTMKSSTQEEMGRGSGCSSSAPSVTNVAAKTIYHISVELVRLVGPLRSLRPVLESVFHRMLLYPPTFHRLDALKAIRELLRHPECLLDLAGPTLPDEKEVQNPPNSKRKIDQDVALLKLIVDSIQECCQCNDSSVCITTVNLVNDLLTTIEQLVKGNGIPMYMIREIHTQYKELEGTYYDLPMESTVTSDKVTPGSLPWNNKLNDDDVTHSDPESDPEHIPDTTIEDCDSVRKHKITTDDSGHDVSKCLHNQAEIEEKFKGGRKMKPDYDGLERQCARDYCQALMEVIPTFLKCVSTYDVDQMMIKFASYFCQRVSGKSSDDVEGGCAILNADGVYLATYSTLLFNLKLIRCGYYHSEEKSLPITQQQFVDDILSTGLLVYLSPSWLSEVYQHVIQSSLLEEAGYRDICMDEELPVIQALTDIDGLNSRKVGGQLMSEFRNMQEDPLAVTDESKLNPAGVEAGMKFARRLLIVCWDGILDVLSVLFNGKSTCGITGSLTTLLVSKEEGRRARDAICTSLDALQRAARLSCTLGLQDRCGAVFGVLANASCVIEDMKKDEKKLTGSSSGNKGMGSKLKVPRIHAAHALSMDVVLSIGLEMGSHSGDCWKHVLRCCAHILNLEHTYYSGGHHQGSELAKVQQISHEPQFDLCMDPLDPDDPEMYTTLITPTEPVTPKINIASLIKMSSGESGWESSPDGGGILNYSQAAKVLTGLTQQVDKLLEDVSRKLNMKALVSFLSEMCKVSRQQLSGYGGSDSPPLSTNALHLYRLGDILQQILHSDKPLLHLMRTWSVVAPHLVEAACHRDRNISKKAVTCIHEFVTTLLCQYEELPHSHFNESLCKPFENLLCLKLCDGDVQDQIVCSICELVEACASEIRSGWRPLFGALRAVKIEYTVNEEVNDARQRHVTAVLDVFDVFLNTDNELVFANAAVDCILCLLKYVRGPGEFEAGEEEDDWDSGSETGGNGTEDLCMPALHYLEQCCSILATMWNMPACPVFSGAHRIQVTSTPKCVDPVIPNMDLTNFQKSFTSDVNIANKEGEDAKPDESNPDGQSLNSIDSGIGVMNSENSNGNSPSNSEEINRSTAAKSKHRLIVLSNRDKLGNTVSAFSPVSLNDLDNHTGVLHVWFLVLDGLANTVSNCPKNYQPQTLEVLFSLLRSAASTPGADFSLYCVNHLLLPMLQSWLRQGMTRSLFWNKELANFKQCVGLCIDLVVEFIIQFIHVTDCHAGLEFMLKQSLDVLIECMAQPNESLARLGCSCTRHCLLSSGPVLTENMWHISVLAIRHAMDVTLYNLKILMTPFEAYSDNFYGDIGHVKVAVRKDCSSIEAERLRQLAQQVFLLDKQRVTTSVIDYEKDEERSFIFLIYPPNHQTSNNIDLIVTRISFRSVVVGLVCHQMMLQLIGCILVQGSEYMVTVERNMMPTSPTDAPIEGPGLTSGAELNNGIHLPGMLQYLSCCNVLLLMDSLYYSYKSACDFDERPGLKFLVQKVSRADVAANLYKQAGISMTFYCHTLMEICARQKNVSINSVHLMLSAGSLYMSDTESQLGSSCSDPEYLEACNSTEPIQQHMGVFVRKMKECFDEICTKYVDMYIDAEGPAQHEGMPQKVLVFLLAEPDEVPQLKREKSISVMVAEKLKMMQSQKSEDDEVSKTKDEQIQGNYDGGDTQIEVGQDMSTTMTSRTGSPPGSAWHQHKCREDVPDKVYTVATDQTIKNLMTEYKKKKKSHTMPTFVKQPRSKPPPIRKERQSSKDLVDQQIDQQHKDSIMKDSEAQLKSWIEMVCNVLHLFHQLPDFQYRALLPVIFNCVNQMICYCKDPYLREALGLWTNRIGHLCGIAPAGAKVPKLPPQSFKNV